MNITIRTAVPGDREKIRPLQKEIADLHHEGRPDLFKTEARYFTDESFAERLQKPGFYVYIAESETGEVVGYAFANIIQYRGNSTYVDFNKYYIDDICVLQKFRKHGIGTLLFQRCRETAQQLKCHNIDLGVYAFNREAIAFYRSCGMREQQLRMELRLDQ
jgi:ribosomal protein S18 acetylase RimI-like enzyme